MSNTRRIAAPTSSRAGKRPLRRAALGAPLLAQAPEDPAAAVLLETGIQPADLDQGLIGDRLLLIARRLGDLSPADRLSVLDRDLRELQALPVADSRGAMDGDRHHRGSRLERQAPDPALGLLGHFAGARPSALAV